MSGSMMTLGSRRGICPSGNCWSDPGSQQTRSQVSLFPHKWVKAGCQGLVGRVPRGDRHHPYSRSSDGTASWLPAKSQGVPCLFTSTLKTEGSLCVLPTVWEMGNLLLAGKSGILLPLLPTSPPSPLFSCSILCFLQPLLLLPRGFSRQVGLAQGSHDKWLKSGDKLCSFAQSFWKAILMWIKIKEV